MKRLLTCAIILLVSVLGSLTAQPVFLEHSVRWFEDLYSISAKYDVPPEVIVAVNALESDALKTRQILRIPSLKEQWPAEEELQKARNVLEIRRGSDAGKKSTAPSVPAAAGISVTGVTTVSENSAQTYCPGDDVSAGNIRIGILMPFTSANGTRDDNSLDFYSGVLAAVRELNGRGIGISLEVRDYTAFEKDGCGKLPFEDSCHFLLGPVRYRDLCNVMPLVDSSCFVVSPLDHKADSLAERFPNFIQAAPLTAAQYSGAIQWLEEECERQHKPLNCIVVENPQEPGPASLVKSMLRERDILFLEKSCDASNPVENLDSLVYPDRNNVVIMPISNEAVLNNAIRNVGIAQKTADIIALCNGKACSYPSIEVEELHKARIRSLCLYHIDLTDERTRSFFRTYRTLFNTEPSEFACQGYDLTCFIVSTYHKLGSAWADKVDKEPEMEMLQADFKLQRLPSGGFVNHGVRRVSFGPDYKVTVGR